MTSSSRALILAGLTVLVGGLGGERAEAVCSCTHMTIHTTGGTETLCSNQNLNFPECAKTPAQGAGPCAAYTYQYVCPVGPTNQSSTENHYGFVAEAQIAGGSTLSDCAKGQALQLTITSNMGVTKPVIAYPQPAGTFTIGGATFAVEPGDGVKVYPDVGTNDPNHNPLYGADNYSDPASPSHLIQWSNGALKWWDNTDQTKDAPAEQATWKYRFVSFVKGSAGQSSCACFFEIDLNWASNAAAPVVTPAQALPGSTSCTVQ